MTKLLYNLDFTRKFNKNYDQVSSMSNLIEKVQMDLLQAQVELQESQNQVQQLEVNINSLVAKERKKTFSTKSVNTNNVGTNEEEIKTLRNEINILQKDNQSVIRKLESTSIANSKFRTSLEKIRNELKKKEKMIHMKTQENKKLIEDLKQMEVISNKQAYDMNFMKNSYYQQINSLHDKTSRLEAEKSSNVTKLAYLEDELKKQKCNLNNVSNYEMKIEKLESTKKMQKENFEKDIKNYEVKVKTIIEEFKIQNQKLNNSIKKKNDDINKLKEEVEQLMENNKVINSKLLSKENEMEQVKHKLNIYQHTEDEERLLKQEIDEKNLVIEEYKQQLGDTVGEKDRYYTLSCDQANAIQHLLDEVGDLQQQLKHLKREKEIQSFVSNSYGRSGNLKNDNSLTNSPLDSQMEIENIQSQHQYDNMHGGEGDDNANSDLESSEAIYVKNISPNRKNQTDASHNHQNSNNHEQLTNDECQYFIGVDEFSKYLEQQLEMIKAASEKNMASIKKEISLS